ncbi:hypothetical protein O3M35_009592 [Rhynocoris fuscipes]|uniref:Peptidase S1 domain-containing protein n=1 Tax=Rhynocoris fuscipes TaxID=488301 RepID=A0AAW1D3I7_9HEMI
MMASLILITLVYLNFVHPLKLPAPSSPNSLEYQVTYDLHEWRNISEHLAIIFTEKYICSCSLITLNFCITGAECFEFDNDTSKMIVIAGATDFRLFDPRAQVRKIKRFIAHEGYRPGGYLGTDDIAIVELSYPLYENFRIKTLKLPTRYMLNNRTKYATATFYIEIYNKRRQYGSLARCKVLLPSEYECACQDLVSDSTRIFDEEGNVIARFICITYTREGLNESRKSCKYSAGEPLMIDDTLIAIKSAQYHIKGCARNEKGQFERMACDRNFSEAGFLQIYSYIDWINTYIPQRKVTLRRPRTIVKNYNIDMKPILPLILCAALYFIIIMIVLICCMSILPKLKV